MSGNYLIGRSKRARKADSWCQCSVEDHLRRGTLYPGPDPVGLRKHVAHRGDEGHRSLATLHRHGIQFADFPVSNVRPLNFEVPKPVPCMQVTARGRGQTPGWRSASWPRWWSSAPWTGTSNFEPWPANLINGGADADDLSLLNSRWRPSATGDAGATAGVVRRWAEG